MLSLGGGSIWLYSRAADFRKSFNGLSGLVSDHFEGRLYTGDYFVFLNRPRTQVRILHWDGDGFVLWAKRLSKGTFWRDEKAGEKLDRRALMLLLEGVKPKRLASRFSLAEKE